MIRRKERSSNDSMIVIDGRDGHVPRLVRARPGEDPVRGVRVARRIDPHPEQVPTRRIARLLDGRDLRQVGLGRRGCTRSA